MLHDAESELDQKLLIADVFPGTLLTSNISETIDARTWKKYFLNLHLKVNVLIYIANLNFEL